MNKVEVVSLGLTLVIVLAIVGIFAGLNNVNQQIDGIKADTNFLGRYVLASTQQNQEATTFLQGCKATQDNNTSITLVCLK
jgi:hypothetical protein